jgi:transglutaminase-like putative cysteine protease
MPPRRHITIGWGRDYADIAPLRGVLIGPPASQDIEVAVDVIAQEF